MPCIVNSCIKSYQHRLLILGPSDLQVDWLFNLKSGRRQFVLIETLRCRHVMPPSPPAFTVGSKAFQPSHLFEDNTLLDSVHSHLNKNDFRSAIVTAFGLQDNDDYIYHATASVTLAQVQVAINAGAAHGLHDWYLDESSRPCGHPPVPDIAAYISLFDPSKSSANTLKGLISNAKKDSLRSGIGKYLTSRRHVDPSFPTVSKRKKPHVNPYIDFWSYSCHALEYAGPNANTFLVKASHHILPIFMHHFSCVCPSYEALAIISSLAKDKTLIDMGSGNGYWTYALRHEHSCNVIAVDSGQSKWRTVWVSDTVVADGVQFLRKRGAGKEDVLLMVYPITSNDFTPSVIKAFQGDTICIAGTQNGNGYTGFKDRMVDTWFKENMPGWKKMVQIPLPSFPGKDDALFVFQKEGTK